MIKIRIKCSCCNNNFEVSDREYFYYQKKGYQLPKYCKSCREKRRVEAYRCDCKKCGKVFAIDGLELAMLKKKYGDNFKMPCKCKECKSK